MIMEHEKSGFIGVRESYEGVAHVNVLALPYQLADLLSFSRLERP